MSLLGFGDCSIRCFLLRPATNYPHAGLQAISTALQRRVGGSAAVATDGARGSETAGRQPEKRAARKTGGSRIRCLSHVEKLSLRKHDVLRLHKWTSRRVMCFFIHFECLYFSLNLNKKYSEVNLKI